MSGKQGRADLLPDPTLSHDMLHERRRRRKTVKQTVKSKKTIYVVSRDGLYAIDPSGKVTRPYSAPDEIGNKKKKAATN
jgi:hypothetical protein